jgi:hypothetical protein
MNNVTAWLDRLFQTCEKTGQQYLDIIIDQCGMDISVIPALCGFSPEIKWHSLYQGLPEDIYREDAPLLVRIELNDEQQVLWMRELAEDILPHAPLLVIGSLWNFPELAKWLGQCVNASHEGREGIFRFWDTRIFPYLFSSALSDEGQKQLLRPAIFWSWLDQDGNEGLITGSGRPVGKDTCKQITFTDRQFETLMCLADAKRFLTERGLPVNRFSSKEEAFFACFNAMQLATKERLLLDEDRDTLVLQQLTR